MLGRNWLVLPLGLPLLLHGGPVAGPSAALLLVLVGGAVLMTAAVLADLMK